MEDFKLSEKDLTIFDVQTIAGYQFGVVDEIGVSIIRADIYNDLKWLGSDCKCIVDEALERVR
jgi:hypothetical protein